MIGRKADMILRMLALVAAGCLFSVNAFATDVTQVIAENIKGTKILNVSVHTIPNDDGLMLIVETSAGMHKFIVTKEDIVAALAMLQNPEAYGANNAILLNRTIPHLPTAKPLSPAKNPIAPANIDNPPPAHTMVAAAKPATTPVTTQNLVQAPAIVSSMVLSANQQASK
jgi:hypothetical protein